MVVKKREKKLKNVLNVWRRWEGWKVVKEGRRVGIELEVRLKGVYG